MSTANGSMNSQAPAPTNKSKKLNKSNWRLVQRAAFQIWRRRQYAHTSTSSAGEQSPKQHKSKFFYYGETINWINPLQNQLQGENEQTYTRLYKPHSVAKSFRFTGESPILRIWWIMNLWRILLIRLCGTSLFRGLQGKLKVYVLH